MKESSSTIIVLILLFTVMSVILSIQKQKKRQKKASFNFEREKETAKARELKAKETLALKKVKENKLMNEDFGSKNGPDWSPNGIPDPPTIHPKSIQQVRLNFHHLSLWCSCFYLT